MKLKNPFSIRLHKALIVFFLNAVRKSFNNPGQAVQFFKTVRCFYQSARRRARWEREGVQVPAIIIYSITQKCNLKCKGCYAQGLHPNPDGEMTRQEVEKFVREASDLGVSFFVVAGGEPFIREDMLEMTEAHPEIIFLVFTNGLLINDQTIERLKQQRNVVPLISIEGYREETDKRRGEGVYQSILELSEKLRRNRIFFGTSVTLTRETFPILTNPEFVKEHVRVGSQFFLYLEYTPIQKGTEDWIVTLEQRSQLVSLMKRYQSRWPALFMAVPAGEAEVGGCLAAGRGFVHVNANGNLEPCPFAPFSDSNIREMPLREALRSSLLANIRQYPEELVPEEGGCVLWKKREWVKSLMKVPEV
jgi:MoaA/NifB/PqqE/SkfB family radical SAM enzyme